MNLRSRLNKNLPLGGKLQLTKRSLWGHLPACSDRVWNGPPQLALTFDLDYQADTDALPGLLDLLKQLEMKSTLFCIGELVRRDPLAYRQAALEGHEIGNHTETHPDNPVLNPDREFWHLSESEMRAEIGNCQDTLEEFTGMRPQGFRTPHFKDACRMMNVLKDFPEITYVSTALASKCPQPMPYHPTKSEFMGDLSLHFAGETEEESWPQLMIPLTPHPTMRWSPFCSYSSIRRPANPAKGAGRESISQWEASWGKTLSRNQSNNFASSYFDPLDVMRDKETIAAFKRMLILAKHEGWEITTLRDIETVWRK